MTRRTRILVAPLLASLCLAACGEDTNGGDGAAGTATLTTGDAPATGSAGASNTGVPTGTTPGTPTAPGATGGGPIGSSTGGATGAGATGTPGATASSPGATGGSTGGAMDNTGGTMNAGGAMNAGGTMNAGGAGGTGGSDPVGGDAGGPPQTPEPDPDVLTVQLQEVRQIIRGFGINATIMPGGESLPWQQLFSLEGNDALGLSILRIGMSEGDENPNNTTTGHRGVPSDWQSARNDYGARVIGSCWSAPGSWKTNGITTQGGHLLPEYYEAWARRIATYANTHGLDAMSIANEADFASCRDSGPASGGGVQCAPPLTNEYESMVYTGKEMAEFVKVAGPIFDEVAPDTKMIAPEASLWQHVWSSVSPDGRGLQGGGYLSSDPLNCGCFANEITAEAEATCAAHCRKGANGELAEGGYDYGHWLASDPGAWSAFDIMGVHQYETQVGYAWPDDVNGGVRDREVWQTEMSGVSHWPEAGHSRDINNGIAVARWIHSALTVGEASAWLYWWYKAYYNDNNEGLALRNSSAASAANEDPNMKAKRYYTMGNFSRYIRPDVFHAVRVAGPSPANVMVSAYKGDNDEVVIVAINETGQAVEVPIAITGGAVPAAMVPHVTTAAANWAEGAAVPVTDGSLQASLPSMSVTTFVSQ